MRRSCARQADPAVTDTAFAMLEDEFSIGASHHGLVMQAMASSVQEQMEDYAEGRLPGRIARKVARQMFHGLDCLHKAGVGHGGEDARYKLNIQTEAGWLTSKSGAKIFTPEICFLRLLNANPPLKNNSFRSLGNLE